MGWYLEHGDACAEHYCVRHECRLQQPDPSADRAREPGIAVNKLLNDIIGPNGLARYDRDVLTQTGVTHVIVFLGNNDIIFVFSAADVVTVDQIIAGHRQLIRRAHARGLRIYGARLTPFGGFALYSADKENNRQAVNNWIRTGGEYDAVIDFDAVVRDPNVPSQLHADYDSGDHLHQNDAGYQAMADAIELTMFKSREGHQVFVSTQRSRRLTKVPATPTSTSWRPPACGSRGTLECQVASPARRYRL